MKMIKTDLNRLFALLLLCLSFFQYMSCTSEDEPLPVNCETSNLAVSFTALDPSSCAATNGAITATAAGGDAPYEFAINTQSYSSNGTFTGLGAGTYLLRVKDKNGCERNTSVLLNPSGSTLAATLQLTDSGCKTTNGVIVVNVTGGAAPYSYRINDGATSSTNAFFGLGTGNYSIKVTDNTGCTITQSVNILSGVKFSTQVKPIIDTYCAISGCHMEGGNISFKVLSNIQASAKDVKSRTQSGNMPKNGPKLEQAYIDAIACWVDDGAKDN
jgi:SprB repeat